MKFNLEGKNVLLTGGSRGIGKQIVLDLAQLGANIAFTYGRSAEAAETVKAAIVAKGVKCLIIQADAADYALAQSTVEQVVKDWDSVDVLVNNAGITRDNLLLRMSEEQWDQVIQTNLKSVFNYSKAVARPMMKNRGGSIVNISSVIGLMGNGGQANYAASKAGIIGFSKSMAKELSSRNIRVNVVAPGYIFTDMTEALDEKALGEIEKAIPLKRGGKVEEVSSVVAFLASELSSYVTGAIIPVDGGMAM